MGAFFISYKDSGALLQFHQKIAGNGLFDFGFQFVSKFRVIHDQLFHCIAALAQAGIPIAKP